MSEDIHKWATDGRYVLMFDEHTFFVWDNVKDKRMTALNVTKKLNEQQEIISALKEENEQLRKQVESSETTSNATSHYNAFLESKITTLEKENEELKQKLESIGLNEKNDMVKMVDGKFFMRM